MGHSLQKGWNVCVELDTLPNIIITWCSLYEIFRFYFNRIKSQCRTKCKLLVKILHGGIRLFWCCCCSVAKSCLTLCDSMNCSTPERDSPSLFTWVCLNSCPSNQWCHPTISSSVAPFSSCPPFSPASGSFPIVSSGHQVAKVLELQLQHWVSEVAQSCLTICNPMYCSLPGSSVHGILQARILEWVAISFSRGSSQPTDWTQVSRIVDRCFTIWARAREALSFSIQFSSVQFSRSVMSDSLRPHESQHTRPPCPSPTPRVYLNSCPSSRWCHPAISSSVAPSSSFPQSLPASGSFPMSQLFTWGGQSIGASALDSVKAEVQQYLWKMWLVWREGGDSGIYSYPFL